MKLFFHMAILASAYFFAVSDAHAQVSFSGTDGGRASNAIAPPATNVSGPDSSTGGIGAYNKMAGLGAPPGSHIESLPPQQTNTLVELAQLQKNMEQLIALKSATQEAAQKDAQLQKQVELLQKQIEVQQKMIQLLLEHVQKQPLAGTPVEKIQTQVATLEARSKQAAQRDQELANAVDN